MQTNSILLKFFILSLCLVNNYEFFAQNNQPQNKDSLYRIIFNEKNNLNTRVSTIGSFCKIYGYEDTVLVLVDQLIKNKKCSQNNLFHLQFYKGDSYYKSFKISPADSIFAKAYEILENNDTLTVNLRFFINYGGAKLTLGENDKAIELFNEGIRRAEKKQDHEILAYIYVNMAIMMDNINKPQDSEKYYNKALISARKAKNKLLESHSLMGIGRYLGEHKMKYEESAVHLTKAIEVVKDVSENLAMEAKSLLGVTYLKMNRYKEAKEILDEVEAYFLKNKIMLKVANTYLNQGQLALAENKATEAFNYYKKAKDLFVEFEQLKSLAVAYDGLYYSSKLIGNYKEALEYYENYNMYNDSLVNENNIQKITELRKDFDFEKEKQKISIENSLKIDKEKSFQKYLTFGLLLLSGLLFFAYRAFRITKEANRTITLQKEQLEKFNATNENLIFSLSHDIKEPMLGVQLLLNKIKTDDAYLKRATASIGDQVASINSIVNNLLQLKKISATGEIENSDHVEILKTLDKISSQLGYRLIEKNIHLINTVHESPGLSLPISSQKLYLTLLNLLTNAIKYSPENSKIEVFAKADGIYVRDYGTGINPNIMNNIGKENIEKEDNNSGSGMGLMLVSNLLTGTKMKLHFENMEDQGTLAGIKVV